MRKSQIYQTAMVAVIESKFDPYIKIDVLRELMDKQATAEWVEAQEGQEDE